MWALAAALLLLQAPDFNADGRKALEARNYEAAVQSFAKAVEADPKDCLLYTSPSPRDGLLSRMPSSA